MAFRDEIVIYLHFTQTTKYYEYPRLKYLPVTSHRKHIIIYSFVYLFGSQRQLRQQ
jgi:hypothetical protein